MTDRYGVWPSREWLDEWVGTAVPTPPVVIDHPDRALVSATAQLVESYVRLLETRPVSELLLPLEKAIESLLSSWKVVK